VSVRVDEWGSDMNHFVRLHFDVPLWEGAAESRNYHIDVSDREVLDLWRQLSDYVAVNGLAQRHA
jgi:hypothetical protein